MVKTFRKNVFPPSYETSVSHLLEQVTRRYKLKNRGRQNTAVETCSFPTHSSTHHHKYFSDFNFNTFHQFKTFFPRILMLLPLQILYFTWWNLDKKMIFHSTVITFTLQLLQHSPTALMGYSFVKTSTVKQANTWAKW